MQAHQIPQTQTPPAESWYVIRSGTNRRKRKAAYRRWRHIHERSGTAMLLFAPLFFLVWLGISMLQPSGHLIPGIILMLILAAEAACVIAHLLSEYMMCRLK